MIFHLSALGQPGSNSGSVSANSVIEQLDANSIADDNCVGTRSDLASGCGEVELGSGSGSTADGELFELATLTR
jgi:hypothetical protein